MSNQPYLRTFLLAGVIILAGLAVLRASFFASAQDNRIRYGDSVDGSLEGPGETDTWIFEGLQGDVVVFRIARTDGTLIPRVTLTGPAGNLLVSLNAPQDGSALEFTVSLSAGGAHTITLSAVPQSEGTYTLRLQLQQERLGAAAGDGIITYDRTVNGVIADTNFRQFWAFRGSQGDIVDATMIAMSGDLDTYLSIISPDGDVIASSDSGAEGTNAALWAVALPSTGTYTLSARRTGENFGENGTSEGLYNLTLTLRAASYLGNTTIIPSPLDLAEPTRGRLNSSAAAAFYTVEVPANFAVILRLANPAQPAAVTIMTTAQALLGTFSGVGELFSSLSLSDAGTVWIEIAAPGTTDTEIVDFSLVVYPLTEETRSARPLYYGQMQTSASPLTGVESWYFVGQAGDLIRIQVQPDGPMLNGRLALTGPDGAALVQRAVVNGLDQPLVLTMNGLYKVSLESQATSGGYKIGVDREGMDRRAFDQRALPENRGELPLGVNGIASGNLSPGSSQVWTLDAAEAQTWQFTLQQSDNNPAVALAVESPGGVTLEVVVTDDFRRSASAVVRLPHAGRFRAVVFDPSGNTSHAYSLQAELEEGLTLSAQQPTKGVLSSRQPADYWTIHTLPGTLLHIRTHTLVGGTSPLVIVTDGNGLTVASTTQTESQGNDTWLGFPAPEGGDFNVVVKLPADVARLVYEIETSSTFPFEDILVFQPISSPASFESFTTPSTPIPVVKRVNVSDQIVPALAPSDPLLDTAPRIEPETLVRGEIVQGAHYQAWLFPANAREMLEFSIAALESADRPGLMILDQNRQVLAELTPGQDQTGYLVQRFAAGGLYWVIARLDQGGKYTLWIDRLSGIDESVPTVLPGQTIGYGDTVAAEIVQPGEARNFVFFGYAQDRILAQIVNQIPNIPLHLVLLPINGTPLSQVTSTSEQPFVVLEDVVLPTDGLYQLAINRADVDELDFVSFTLHLNLTAARQSSERGGGVLGNSVVAGLTSDDPTHRWLFAAQSGEDLSFTLEPLTPGGPTPLTIELADSAGNVFFRRSARLGQNVLKLNHLLLPRQGVYQVIISGGQRRSGTYRLDVVREPTSLNDNERAVRFGETNGKVLNAVNTLDVWTFAGSQGDTISVSVRTVRGDIAPIGMQVRTRDGVVLGTATGDLLRGLTTLDNLVLPVSGHYVIIVGNLGGATFEGLTAYEVTVHLRQSAARSMGDILQHNQVVEGVFFVDDPTDTWLFDSQQGETISFTLSAAVESVPSMTLFSTDWHSVNSSGQAEVLVSAQALPGQPAQIEFPVPLSATYALTIEDTTLAGGGYRLEVSSEEGLNPVAGILRPDQVRESEIGAAMVIETWRFDGLKDTAITAGVAPDTRSSLAPVIRLLNPEGVVLAQSQASSGKSAQISLYHLRMDGTYYIQVARALDSVGRTDGRYTLTLSQTAAKTVAVTPTAYGKRELSLLDATAPVDVWTFDGQAGDVIHLVAKATSGDLDPVLRLFARNGVLIAASDDLQNTDADLRFALPYAGSYLLEVSRYGQQSGETSGNYTLALDLLYRLGAAQSNQLLAYGDRVAGTTDGQNPVDQWSFSGEAGDVIYVALQFALDDAPLQLTLYDPAATVLADGVRDRGDSMIERYVLPGSGVYTLEVRRPGDAQADFSPYTLDLRLRDSAEQTPQPGGLLSDSLAMTGSFATGSMEHTWVFVAEADQLVSLNFTRLSGTLAAQITLIAPDGSTLFDLGTPPGAVNDFSSGPLRLALPGIYTLIIRGDAQAARLIYRVALQTLSDLETPAQVITPLEDGFGQIDDLRLQDRWSFKAVAGETLFVCATAVSGDLEPVVLLWGLDNRPLVEGYQNRSHACLEGFVAPTSGDYTVTVGRVGGVSGNTTGSYRLMLRRKAVTTQALFAQDVSFGSAVLGRLDGIASQWFAFQGVSGDTVGFSALSAQGTPEITLENESGQSIQVATFVAENEASVPIFVLPEDGRYLVRLNSSSPLDYQFAVFRRSRQVLPGSTTRNLGRGQAFVESVENPALPVLWTFTGRVGEVLNFEIDTSQSSLRADMVLFGPRGYITSASEKPGSETTILGPVRLPGDGDYLLLVGAWLGEAGGSTGLFAVRVLAADSGISGSLGGHIPALNVPVTGGLIAEDTQDVWTFDGQAGERITIRAEQQSESGVMSLALVGPDGSVLAAGRASGTSVEIDNLLLPLTGTYTLTADGQLTNSDPIEYRLVVNRVENDLVASLSTGQGLTFGEQRTAAFTANATHQAWVFYGQQGERITAEIMPLDPAGLSVYLLDPTGQVQFAQASLIPGAVVQMDEVVLSQTGFYGLVIKRDLMADLAEYRVQIQRSAAGAVQQGILIAEGTGRLTMAAPVHTWIIQPEHSGDYLIQARALAAGRMVNLFVQSSTGESLSTGTTSGPSVTETTVYLEAGYQVTVVVSAGLPGDQTDYVISLHPASFVTGTGEFAAGGGENIGRITDQHFTDEWRISASAGDVLTVTINRTSGDLRPTISVYDPSGNRIEQAAGTVEGSAQVSLSLSVEGIYRILVSRIGDAAGETTGDYNVSVQAE
jgi:hypothetical protein